MHGRHTVALVVKWSGRKHRKNRPENIYNRAVTVVFDSGSSPPGASLWYKPLSLLLEICGRTRKGRQLVPGC